MTASALNALAGLISVMGLADRIKQAMGDMTPGELARACKVTPASVTFWLDGSTKSLKAETAALMEAATGYRAQWIVTGKGPKKITDQGEGEPWPFSDELQRKVLAIQGAELNLLERLMRAALDMPPPKLSLVPTDDSKRDSYATAPDGMIYSQEQKGLGSAVAEAAVTPSSKRNAAATNKRSPRQKSGRRA